MSCSACSERSAFRTTLYTHFSMWARQCLSLWVFSSILSVDWLDLFVPCFSDHQRWRMSRVPNQAYQNLSGLRIVTFSSLVVWCSALFQASKNLAPPQQKWWISELLILWVHAIQDTNCVVKFCFVSQRICHHHRCSFVLFSREDFALKHRKKILEKFLQKASEFLLN